MHPRLPYHVRVLISLRNFDPDLRLGFCDEPELGLDEVVGVEGRLDLKLPHDRHEGDVGLEVREL